MLSRIKSFGESSRRTAVHGTFGRGSAISAIAADGAVFKQLRRVIDLQERVRGTNSMAEKQAIISEYPDLRGLLEQVYDVKFRTHLTSTSLDNYLSDPSPSPSKQSISPPTDLGSLFEELSKRTVTGNAAKELVRSFLSREGIINADRTDGGDQPAFEVFKRLLDRNLVAGFGSRTLSEVPWPTHVGSRSPAESEEGLGIPSASENRRDFEAREAPVQQPVQPAQHPAPLVMNPFTCALDKSIIAEDLPSLFSAGSPTWYASRKLDGVRVITLLDILILHNHDHRPRIIGIEHLSRAGNAFSSLGSLESHLRPIESFPELGDWLKHEQLIRKDEGGGGIVKRLVLDGEVCVMRPKYPYSGGRASGAGGAPHALWSDTANLIEDFPSTVSEIKQKKHTILRPRYYLFDMLPWSDLAGTARTEEKKPFSFRAAMLRELGQWLDGDGRENGAGTAEGEVRVLEQIKVDKAEEVEEMIRTAVDRGWEGIVLRADKQYKGARSSDIRKFKQWLDAEYTVCGVELSRQRLAINGVFAEHEAIAALVFHHKGHPVTVSSGLTAEQRIKWAEDPNLIVGRQITVEYFSESEAVGRKGVKSLRFPRIKHVWADERDV